MHKIGNAKICMEITFNTNSKNKLELFYLWVSNNLYQIA